MSFSIDRFEGSIAAVVSDDGKTYNIPKALLPENAKEGDIINIIVDEKKTGNKKNEVRNLLNDLFDERS